MAKFKFTELVTEGGSLTARLGTAGVANRYDDKEIGKAVKLSGDSAYVLASAGDLIEAFVRSMEGASLDDFSIGTVQTKDYKSVVLDGEQATPGTGDIAIGEYVVVGTMVAKGTALTGDQKVCQATSQTVAMHNWRLVSASGTAVGSTGVIERVGH